MLSEELDALRERFEPYLHGGLQAEPEGIELLVETFRSLADEARSLERMKVPEAARVRDADLLDGKVVRLDDHRIEQARFGTLTGGGDAA